MAQFEPSNAKSLPLQEASSLIWTWMKGQQQNQWHSLFDVYSSDNSLVVPVVNFYAPNTTFTDFQLYAYLRKALPQSTLYHDDQ